MADQQVGIHHRGAGALVFLALRQDRAGGRHQQCGEALAQERLGALFVRGIAVAVDQADRNRLDAGCGKLIPGCQHARLVQRLDHAAVGRDALHHLQAMPARHQRLGLVPGQVEHVGHADAADLQHVAEAARGDEPGPGARSLQEGVGADGRAVQHFFDPRCRYAQLPQERIEAGNDPAARIVRRGRHLALVQHAATGHQDDVGKRAADIDRNAHVSLHHRSQLSLHEVIRPSSLTGNPCQAAMRHACGPYAVQRDQL